ncbi:MAG: RHS repeat-associated core domain-containing protein [Candidatus Polarisedimenticolia bacterium]
MTPDVTNKAEAESGVRYRTKYGYDLLGRLTAAATSGWELSWSYDKFGNREAQRAVRGNAPAATTTSDASTNHVSGFSYDADGNIVSTGNGTTYVYDGENRLVSLNSPSGTSTFSYDGFGRRVSKSEGGVTTLYSWFGRKLVSEMPLGGTPSELIYGVDSLVAVRRGTGLIFLHRDDKSTRVVTDGSGSVLRSSGHYPFGELWYQEGANPQSWNRVLADYTRESGGVDYSVFRWYDPAAGRFLSADPVDGSLAVPQSLERYGVGEFDPINVVDPLGLCGWRTLLDDGVTPPTGFWGWPEWKKDAWGSFGCGAVFGQPGFSAYLPLGAAGGNPLSATGLPAWMSGAFLFAGTKTSALVKDPLQNSDWLFMSGLLQTRPSYLVVDARGRVVDSKNDVLPMTTNVPTWPLFPPMSPSFTRLNRDNVTGVVGSSSSAFAFGPLAEYGWAAGGGAAPVRSAKAAAGLFPFYFPW